MEANLRKTLEECRDEGIPIMVAMDKITFDEINPEDLTNTVTLDEYIVDESEKKHEIKNDNV